LADVNANIGVNIDTSNALAQLKLLQREISRFHTSVARSSDAAGLAQRDLQKNFVNGVNSIKGFSAELRTIKTTAESFTNSLEKNKFSMREYFRYSAASTKTFGRFFRSEFDTVNKVAIENVKRLQTQYIKMGRDANGAMKAIAVMPTKLDMTNLSTQTQMAAQKQAIFNQLVKQGSTNLLNFGKNTQWAGRQLMVGFTLPLIGLGSVASKTFMQMESAAIKFKKVYGDLFTAPEETQFALDSIKMLGREFTKYGIAVSQTLDLAAEAAAAGYEGAALTAQVTQATRLQVLGQIDQQKALEATIALQNAFRISSNDLAASVNFLNAVENQTVLSLDDIAQAVPRVGPIITELGGDIKDLAFFLTAMKEGGVSAAQGANALKSGLGRLINPTKAATEYLEKFDIDLKGIIETNAGDLRATVMSFANALQPLDDLSKARAVEKVFGKFQFARTLALLNNITRDGTQAARVLDLASASTEELAALAESELGITAESAMNKFKAAAENLKASLVPIGETFLQVMTPILDKVNSLLEWFNGLSDTSKKVITKVLLYLGGLAPVILMTIGLMANFIANGIKGLLLLRNGFLRLTGQSKILSEQTSFLTLEQQNAIAAAASLEQSHINLQQVFTGEAAAVSQLINEYQRMVIAQNMAAARFPGMMQPGFKAQGYAKGIVSVPGPKGAGDIIPAMLSPGESVIPADMTKKYAGLIEGMVSGNIPGFSEGVFNLGAGRQSRTLDLSRSTALPGIQRMIDSTLKAANGVSNSSQILEEVFVRLGNHTKVTVDRFIAELDMITSAVNRERLPTSVFQDAGRERVYKGPKSISDQIEGNEVLTEEYNRAQQSAQAAKEAQKQFLIQNNQSLEENEKALNQGGSVQRAHIVQLQDQTDKLFNEAWDPDLWVAQAAPLNQISNILSDNFTTQANQQVYLEKLLQLQQEGLIDEQQMLTIRQKITGGVALTEQELVLQKEILTRILRNAQDMSRMTENFGLQAAGAIGATTYLEENPAAMGSGVRLASNTQQKLQELNAAKYSGNAGGETSGIILRTPGAIEAERAGQTVANSAVVGAAVGAGTASASKKTIPIGEDIARGLQVGMQNQIQETKNMAANLSNTAVSGLINPRTGNPFTVNEIADIKRVSGSQVSGMISRTGQTSFLGMPGFPEKPGTAGVPQASGPSVEAPKSRGLVSRGAGKVFGAGGGFGLSGLVFALSMLPGKFGELSKSIMPAIVGLQSFGMLLRIVGPLPTIFIALGAAAYQLNQEAKKAAEEIADSARLEAEARYGSIKAIEEFAEFSGRARASEREFSRSNRQLISANAEAVKRFAEFYQQEGNRSTKVINKAAFKSEGSGIRAAAVDIAQRAAIFGLEPADIAANIRAASDLIGADQVKIKMAVQEILSPDGKDITKEPLTIKARMEFLQKDSNKTIELINEQIFDISKIKLPTKAEANGLGSAFVTNVGVGTGIGAAAGATFGGVGAGPGAALGAIAGTLATVPATLKALTGRKDLDYASLEKAAGFQKTINDKYSGNMGSKALGALSQVGRNAMGYGYDIDSLKEFKTLQRNVQSASIQTSIAFSQQKESLALLNAQYVDGNITKEEYDELLTNSLTNFDALQASTIDLVNELNLIDPSGKLAADSIKSFGDEAFSALKKANPGMFKKIVKAMEDLDDASQINIMIGYAKGSLTLLDIARLPAALEQIKGKTFEATVKILLESGLSEGAVANMTADAARAAMSEVDKQIATATPGNMEILLARRSVLQKELIKAQKKEQDALAALKGGSLTGGEQGPNDDDKKKITDFFKKELNLLKKKRDALKDINSEMDRQNQYQMKQMDLINQASRAKISGNFLEAAQLQQQSMLEGAKFTRESQELQLDRIIKKVENRNSRIKDTQKIGKKDIALRDKLRAGKYESVVPTPTTPSVGFDSKATGFSGSTTTVGGSMYTVTMNISGENAQDIANKVINKLQNLENKKNKSNKVR
jgi:TP901 family phage tail tape measure protein